MKRVLIFLFLLGSLHVQASPSVRELFLSLPDSVFTQFTCFSEKDSFPQTERKRMLNQYDSGITEFGSDVSIRFHIRRINDSLERIVLDNFADQHITLQILERKSSETFFSLCSSVCDFVQCKEVWMFYVMKKNKLRTVEHVLPGHYPMRLFFDPAYLKEMGVNPEMDIQGINFYYEDGSREITAYLNTDYFDKELFGEEHPMVKLNPEKLLRSQINLRREGRRFVFVL